MDMGWGEGPVAALSATRLVSRVRHRGLACYAMLKPYAMLGLWHALDMARSTERQAEREAPMRRELLAVQRCPPSPLQERRGLAVQRWLRRLKAGG